MPCAARSVWRFTNSSRPGETHKEHANATLLRAGHTPASMDRVRVLPRLDHALDRPHGHDCDGLWLAEERPQWPKLSGSLRILAIKPTESIVPAQCTGGCGILTMIFPRSE